MKTRPNNRIRSAKQPFQKRPETPDLSSVEALFQKAVAHHRAGQLSQAEALYQHILQISPDNPRALHLLGVMACQVGKFPLALELLDRAIHSNPHDGEAYNNRGNVFHGLQQYQAALESFDKAISLRPNLAEAYSNRGNALNGLQQYQAALESFDKAISLRPNFSEAYSNRGDVLNGLQRYQEALESCDTAISLKPDFMEAYSNRGAALNGLRQYSAALVNCDKAISLNSGFAKAYSGRGDALNGLQQYQLALECFDKAIDLKPDYAEAYNNRGNALHGLRQYQAALESFDRALSFKSEFAEAYNNRGNLFYELQQYQAALESFDKAIRIRPNFAQAFNDRSCTLLRLQQYQGALESCDKAIFLKPDYAEAYNNRGIALNELQQFQEALESFDKAISLKSDFAEAYNNRGNALQRLRQSQAALESFDKAISLKSDFADAHNNRGSALHDLWQYQAAAESFDKAISLKPDLEYLNGTRLHLKRLLCDWENIESQCQHLEAQIDRIEKAAQPFITLSISGSPALQRRAAEIYVRDKCAPFSTTEMIPHRPKRDRIRIGYFSANYYDHAVAYLIAELFERHDRSRFEILGFSFGPDVKDEMSQRVSAAMDRFLDVRSMSDRGVAQLSRELEVDIAVDLMGFTKDSRFGIFAERAAPIQVNYLGYPGTTGAGYMDYLIADRTLIPESSQEHYSEKIVYLPDSYQANDSQRLISDKTSSRTEEGLPEQGFVFCCFNNNYKIAPGTFDLWMRILGQVQGSVLWLLEDNPWAAGNLRKEAARRGISSKRIIFARRLPLAEHLARHRLADLFLDTLPYNAHTTASDALRAGLPVLTCLGEAFASRVAASLLRAIDLPELITTTEAEYEALAAEIALNAERHHAIRERLRQNLPTAPLFNIRSFTDHIETAYSAMYERYQTGLPAEHIGR